MATYEDKKATQAQATIPDATDSETGLIQLDDTFAADASNPGLLKANIQDVSTSTDTSTGLQANVEGYGNVYTRTVNGFSDHAAIITVTFMYRYDNNNGTALTTRPRIHIYDTTSTDTINNEVQNIGVVTGFDDKILRTVTCIAPPVTGTTYTIEAWEENTGGGSYNATNGMLSISCTKLVLP